MNLLIVGWISGPTYHRYKLLIIMCTSSVLNMTCIPVFTFFQAINWLLALLTIQGGIVS